MKHRIVILGAGFVGVAVANQLSKQASQEVEIILIDPKDHFLFSPLLIERLSNDIDDQAIRIELDPWCKNKNITFIRGSAQDINKEALVITYTNSLSGLEEKIRYDTVVICPGAKPSYYNIPGAEEHTFTLKKYEDVKKLQDTVSSLVQQAQTATDQATQQKILTFGVAGAGATGIEALFSLKSFIEKQLKATPKLLPLVSYFIVEAAPDILPGFPDRLRQGTLQALKQAHIQLFLNEAVRSVEATQVTTANRVLPTSCLLWTAGIQPGKIPVSTMDATKPPVPNSFLQLSDKIYIAGDSIQFEYEGKRVPKNGQISLQMADLIAKNIILSIKNEPLESFKPEMAGFFLSVGSSGFMQYRSWTIKSRLTQYFRKRYYQHRLHQMTH